jgi:hypothetical protein
LKYRGRYRLERREMPGDVKRVGELLEQSVKLERGQKIKKHLISCKILTANSFARYN